MKYCTYSSDDFTGSRYLLLTNIDKNVKRKNSGSMEFTKDTLYTLDEAEGIYTYSIFSKDLKGLLKRGRVSIVNAKLTSDNRLIRINRIKSTGKVIGNIARNNGYSDIINNIKLDYIILADKNLFAKTRLIGCEVKHSNKTKFTVYNKDNTCYMIFDCDIISCDEIMYGLFENVRAKSLKLMNCNFSNTYKFKQTFRNAEIKNLDLRDVKFYQAYNVEYMFLFFKGSVTGIEKLEIPEIAKFTGVFSFAKFSKPVNIKNFKNATQEDCKESKYIDKDRHVKPLRELLV